MRFPTPHPDPARRATLAVLAALFAVPCAWARAATASPAARDQQLIAAAGRGDTAQVKRLLAAGADVAARDANGHTALIAAAYGNHVATAEALIAAGAEVRGENRSPRSVLMIAAVRGHLELLRLALRHGADVRILNQYGGTAIIPAAHYGHVEIVRELLKTDMPLDHVNNFGWTALIEAVILGHGGSRHTEIVRMLAGRGANVNIADRDGVTPLAHARRRGYHEIAAILEQAGAR